MSFLTLQRTSRGPPVRSAHSRAVANTASNAWILLASAVRHHTRAFSFSPPSRRHCPPGPVRARHITRARGRHLCGGFRPTVRRERRVWGVRSHQGPLTEWGSRPSPRACSKANYVLNSDDWKAVYVKTQIYTRTREIYTPAHPDTHTLTGCSSWSYKNSGKCTFKNLKAHVTPLRSIAKPRRARPRQGTHS